MLPELICGTVCNLFYLPEHCNDVLYFIIFPFGYFFVVGNCVTVHATVLECCHGRLYSNAMHEIVSYLSEYCHGHM